MGEEIGAMHFDNREREGPYTKNAGCLYKLGKAKKQTSFWSFQKEHCPAKILILDF